MKAWFLRASRLSCTRLMTFFGLIDFHDPEGPLNSLFPRLWLRFRRVDKWPIAQATIKRAHVEEVYNNEAGHLGWRTVLLHIYKVSDVSYTGSARGPVWSYDEPAARETAQGLVGAELPVRYNPAKPAQAIYMLSDGGPEQMLLATPDPKTGLVILPLK
jgi:hypothetical protein